MASIFKKSVLLNKLKTFKIPNFEENLQIIQRWHNDYHKGTLKSDKETSREQAFNQDFFIKILGYEAQPATPYSLVPKARTDKGQEPDLILGFFNETHRKLASVVELKDASTALDKPQQRAGNLSPIQQAFKYKSQYSKCPFVIACNFYEFRLFQDNQLDYEVWTLDDLLNPKNDYFEFKRFYYLLCKDNFTSTKGKSKTENLLADIRVEQEKITKKFYKEYKELRLELLRDLYKNNESIRNNIEFGIEKAQKLIDRIVFVGFCEDRGLLPDNTLYKVLSLSEEAFGSLWATLKGFFEAIDKGSTKLEIPEGYNGGLFKNDPDLNNLKISDSILKKFAEIGKYDFEEDLSVTILGHIFEQSISDLEEIKEKVNESKGLENIEKVGKRKKDGIFYTPDYIVEYIIQNTVGKYLLEKEEELKKKHNLKDDIENKNYLKREKTVYTEYQVILENIKILDPACGSGAFLVKVVDFLLAEHKRIGHILGNIFSINEYSKSILRNNIFGVDLNHESVEITKLSLWLKTAQKGKKLTTLDNNIKCGNSLIDDQSIAGNKAFNWKQEFPDIFKDGGFDIIIGNPPYVATKQIKKEEREFFWSSYEEILFSEMDLYEIFTYDSLKYKLKENGILGFITPNTYFTTDSFQHYRKYLLKNTRILSLIDFPYRFFPFTEVNKETSIIIIRKKEPSKKDKSQIINIDKKSLLEQQAINASVFSSNLLVDQNIFSNIYHDKIIIKQSDTLAKLLKIKSNLGNFLELHKGWMSIPKQTSTEMNNYDKGIFTELELRNDSNLQNIVNKYLEGKDIHRYYIDNVTKYVNITDIDPKTKNWHFSPKIILQRIVGQNVNKIFATYDESNYIIFPNANLINSRNKTINPKMFLPIINSKLISWYYNSYYGESNTNLTKKAFEAIPCPLTIESHSKKLDLIADKLINLYSTKDIFKNNFLNKISNNFINIKITNKIKDSHLVNFKDFLQSLKKQKFKISLEDQSEWEEYFSNYKFKIVSLETEINNIEMECNNLVYNIYNLTKDDIDYIENN